MTDSQTLLSVVVPVYNVEDYLDECLASIAASTLESLEVVLVDDGSTDGSATIAREWCGRDRRFQLIQQENRGLGAARNAGVPHAIGRYLAFLDSDDRVPEAAYERMVTTLERTGSDFATGNVHRFDGHRTWQAPLARGVHDRTRLRTHVSRDRELLRDLLAHNKVWRRTFWDRHQLTFREGVLYEDLTTTIPAHVLADSVDVLSDVVDLWRFRTGGLASITQAKTADARQVRDRLTGVTAVSEFMSRQDDPSLKVDYDHGALERDVRYFVNVLPDVDEDYLEEALRRFRDLLEQVDPEALSRVRVVNRIKYDLIRRSETSALLAFLEKERAGDLKGLALDRRGDRVYLEAPDLGGDRSPTFTPMVLDVTNELQLRTRTCDVSLGRDELVVEGWAFIDKLRADHATTELQLWLDGEGVRVPFIVERRHDPAATRDGAHPNVDFGWAGFRARLPLKLLRTRDRRLRRRWRTGQFVVRVGVAAGPVQVTSDLSRPTTGRAERTLVRDLHGHGKRLRLRWTDEWSFEIDIAPTPPRVTGVSNLGDELELELMITPPPVSASRLTLTDVTLGRRRNYRIERLDDRGRGRVRVPVGHLQANPTRRTESNDLGEIGRWTLKYRRRRNEQAVQIEVPPAGEPIPAPAADFEFAIHRNRHAVAALVERSPVPRMTAARWEGATLHVTLAHPFPGRVEVVRLRHITRSEHFEAHGLEHGEREVRAQLQLGSVSRYADDIPLRTGSWLLEVVIDGRQQLVAPHTEAVEDLPQEVIHRDRRYAIHDRRWHRVAVEVGSELADDELGAFHQRRLREDVYPAMRGKELRPAVVYSCYLGKQFGDSPQSIFEELVRRDAPLEHLVLVRDQQVSVPAPARAIPIWSERAYEALATSRYVVDNTHLPPYFRRAPGQTVLQTWHGIGLKRVGLDIESVQFANRHYQDNIAAEAKNTDYVISPNPFNSPILRRAFDVNGELLETGAPRNDIFFRADRETLANSVRESLGVPDHCRVVLYAPTWRDDIYRGGQYRLDLRLDLKRVAEALGPDHVVLFRKHANIVDKLPPGLGDAVIDTSDYPDVQHLLLISDVLVTDYSTLMFDFANTGRPMLFYTYDLDRYRDVLRGFYFDFEQNAPGPLLASEDEVIAALQTLDEQRDRFAGRYRSFRDQFCAWDDGRAAERVVDAVFAESRENQ